MMVFCQLARSQGADPGILTGNLIDGKAKAVEGATVELIPFRDSTQRKLVLSDKAGGFEFRQIAFGLYKLRVSYVGLKTLVIDSISFRTERADFNMSDIVMKPAEAASLGEVVIYAEKPLVQSKDGNITFNAGESALSAGSNASELLNNVPLVQKDASGKLTVRGKEPKILIDDKPVELNMQQLQDLLESLPGSSIEKIEVMTNPPPQYANEQGGVINIVTKKGRVGKTGRINLSGGTRGEASLNGNYNYRKQGLSFSINGGVGYSQVRGEGHSSRNNIYADSSNFFNTQNQYLNKSWRPNFRANVDYDINKTNSISAVIQVNPNDYRNDGATTYTNLNRFGDIFRLSERHILSTGTSYNPNFSFSYTHKGKTPGETLRIITAGNLSFNDSKRNFFQQYFFPDHTPNGTDSTQRQNNQSPGSGYSARLNYDRPFANKKTFLSAGGYYNYSANHVTVIASYLRKADGVFVNSPALSNDFRFHQVVNNLRGSVKQLLGPDFSMTAGSSVEQTAIRFDLYRDARVAKNSYWTWLPFFNMNRNWKEKLNLTLAYRRSIRRPGIGEMNPAIDFSDPYNVRFGNEKLEASTAHNFDLVLGRNRPKYYLNLGMGYNIVEKIFSQVRTLLTDGKTQITWENISGRKEYEVSSWGGVTLTKKWKTNISGSYTYSQYSAFDKKVNRYRDGGSFTSNINSTYTPKDIFVLTGSFTFNRFASPQGYARWSWSMNLGIQRKFLDKKLVLTANIIDPFLQENRSFTYGSNFVLKSYSTAQTRNFRLSVAYNFNNNPKKKIVLPAIKK